ncbi:hypothetical protein CN514_21070 [Bacillus sp. AFS001701]|uniref:hypothetical protein n=1 Tax=Bacillaceae TaxID=186817 RepID=UPI000BF2A2C9|nr:hypothetical protein [Bacillus sp. AFS001701]PET45411.1 hypothetical protein CN514_21070 [Bacillus sp. AFS001701]
MFNKYKTLSSSFESGMDIKVKEDKKGEKLVSISTSSPNRRIDIIKKENSLEYTIYDVNKGTQQFTIPLALHDRIMNEYLK